MKLTFQLQESILLYCCILMEDFKKNKGSIFFGSKMKNYEHLENGTSGTNLLLFFSIQIQIFLIFNWPGFMHEFCVVRINWAVITLCRFKYRWRVFTFCLTVRKFWCWMLARLLIQYLGCFCKMGCWKQLCVVFLDVVVKIHRCVFWSICFVVLNQSSLIEYHHSIPVLCMFASIYKNLGEQKRTNVVSPPHPSTQTTKHIRVVKTNWTYIEKKHVAC